MSIDFLFLFEGTGVSEEIPNQCQPYVEKALNELNKNVEDNSSDEKTPIELPERPFDDEKSEEYDKPNESVRNDDELINSQETDSKADTELDENVSK